MFLNLYWNELFEAEGTSLYCSSAYRPQSDESTEVVSRSVETYVTHTYENVGMLYGTHIRHFNVQNLRDIMSIN